MSRFFRVGAISLLFAALPIYAFAQSVQGGLEGAKQATVWVACGGRQGSGTVTNGTQGYVVTNGHVAIDVETGTQSASCRVAFPDAKGDPTHFYRASIESAVFNEKLNQDFAVLKIGAAITADVLPRPFPSIKTNEFTSKGDAVSVLGYSGPNDRLLVRTGVITDYVGGFIRTTAEIQPGDSGGGAFDANGNLIGMPTRIVTITDQSGMDQIQYELIDIRAVMTWLDTFGSNEHDEIFTHADYPRYHQAAVFITQTDLGCLELARVTLSPAVYCLFGDGTRISFPTDTTYFSWFSDFSDVQTIDDESMAGFRLVRNATFKPGTLVKLRTASQVYVVIDAFGTLRWIPSETKARELWGPAWAGLVFDVPDEFWINYTIGQPLE